MCAINCIADFSSPLRDAEERVRRLNEAVAHRGPNGEGVYLSADASVALGSRRLSIVDLAGGAMPITLRHQGHDYVIVSNGEFFNHDALRRQLSEKYHAKTRSDTEVALMAYLEWGDACVEHLRGQFAFVVYDESAKRIFFARDRLGIKPLYYALLGGTLVLSSEPKGVLAYPGVACAPDKDALATFMLGAVSMMGKCEPLDRSLFAGVYSLPPGARASFDAKGFVIEQYWDITFPPKQSAEEVIDGLRKEVSRAVSEQVPLEVPYGVPLSGGLDSSIVLAAALTSGVPPIAAVSVRFAGQQNPDYEHARPFAERVAVPLIAPELSGEELMSYVDAFVHALDRPSESTRNVGIFAMYKHLARAGARVALIGEGSDEFNLGYYYTLPGFKDKGEACATAEGFRELMHSYAAASARFFNPSFIDAPVIDAAIARQVSVYYEHSQLIDPLERMQYFYARQFLKGRLDTHDRLAMAHGIEARVPFCDEEVVRISLSARAEDNLADGTEKALLRDAFGDLLPAEIRTRRKSPQPESANLNSHKALLAAYSSALAGADESAWDMLDNGFAREMLSQGQQYVSTLERGEAPSAQLSGFRMRNLFLLLTLLRWHRLYFA